MTTLEDRLPELLTSAAERIDVTPDLDAVINGDHVALRVEEVPAWRRPAAVAVAIAAVVLLVVAGLVVITSIRDSTPVTPADRTVVMDGTSMMATFDDGDELRAVPVNGAIDRGDIVVAELGGATARTVVKRAIAFGGERVEIVNCVVLIDGTAIEEPYLDPRTNRPGTCGGDLTPTTVPDGTMFVLGDNRGGSQDSRALGSIPLDAIVGVVVAVRDPGGDWTPVRG